MLLIIMTRHISIALDLFKDFFNLHKICLRRTNGKLRTETLGVHIGFLTLWQGDKPQKIASPAFLHHMFQVLCNRPACSGYSMVPKRTFLLVNMCPDFSCRKYGHHMHVIKLESLD